MRLEQLEYLIVVCEEGSISAAAKKLHISHQALSIAIKNLEEELQLTLLNRSTKGVMITEEGKEIIIVAKNFIERLDDIVQRFQKENLRGDLIIAGTYIAIEGFLPKAISKYIIKYPNVTVSYIRLCPTMTLELFERGEADIGFVTFDEETEKEILAIYPNITFHHCRTFETGVLLSRNSVLASQKSISIKQLKNETVIFNCAEEIADDLINQCFFDNIQCKKKRYESNSKVYYELVKQNIGVGITSIFRGESLGAIPENVVCLPVKGVSERYFGYFVNREKSFSRLVQAFLKILEAD